jgi:hypothetical protein
VRWRRVDDLDEIQGQDGSGRRLIRYRNADAAHARHHAQLADPHVQHDVGDQGAGDALRSPAASGVACFL